MMHFNTVDKSCPPYSGFSRKSGAEIIRKNTEESAILHTIAAMRFRFGLLRIAVKR